MKIGGCPLFTVPCLPPKPQFVEMFKMSCYYERQMGAIVRFAPAQFVSGKCTKVN